MSHASNRPVIGRDSNFAAGKAPRALTPNRLATRHGSQVGYAGSGVPTALILVPVKVPALWKLENPKMP